jgi:hypothetical protein
MMEVLESPVPNIIGIIGGEDTMANIKSNSGIYSNLIYINESEQVQIKFHEKIEFDLPSLGNLKTTLFKEFNLLSYYNRKP